MKKCEYCNKEISYDEQFCSNDCESKYFNFFKKERKFKNLFGFFSIIGVICPVIGTYACIFHYPVGFFIASVPIFLLSICILFLPFSTDNIIKAFGLKKAIFITRIFAVILLIISFILTFAGISNF